MNFYNVAVPLFCAFYLEKYQDSNLFIKADISKENDVINMYKKIEEKFNRLDGLVITLFMIKYLQ